MRRPWRLLRRTLVLTIAAAGGIVLATRPAHSTARLISVQSADTSISRDPIARLNLRLANGSLTLAHDSVLGYLPALLKALDILPSSQTLVFSRTSLQTDKITPWSPRALYFNDDVYVGYVFDSHFLEIGAVDPSRGAVFYTLNQTAHARPLLTRETTTCLMCHASRSATGGVPGFMVLSTIADRHGYPITGVHDGPSRDDTPFAQRFGGWYVTGTAQRGAHAGNVHAPLLGHEVHDKAAYRRQYNAQFAPTLEPSAPNSRSTLASLFDTTAYLTGQSDLVALLVLTHQTVVHNLITATHEAAREALLIAAISADKPDSTRTPVTPRLRGAVDNLTRALLFAGEAPLPGPVAGTTSFVRDFAARAERDARGRSLRDFDLGRRLFRYPCSFLIYSDAFEALPLVARRAVYARLRDVLTGREPSNLTESDRSAVTEILSATTPEFTRLR